MPVSNNIHDKAQLKVYDKNKNKERIFNLNIHDNWGFIEDTKGNSLTEMELPKGKLPLQTVKNIFKGKDYVASHDTEAHEAYQDDNGRNHSWTKTQTVNKEISYLHKVNDPSLSERYRLDDVLENGKSIMPTNSYHLSHDPKINESTYLVNDKTDDISGQIIPTTKKAVSNLKKAVVNDTIDLQVSPDSKVSFASSVPSGKITNNSSLDAKEQTNVQNIMLNNSKLTLVPGSQVVNSNFQDSTIHTDPNLTTDQKNIIYNSNFDHVDLFDSNQIKSSMIDYAIINKNTISNSSLKGGIYNSSTIENTNTWMATSSIVDHTQLKNDRLENRHVNNDYYQKNFKRPQTKASLTNNDLSHRTPTEDAMVISNSVLSNVQNLQNENIGTTLKNVKMNNTFVKEWVIATDSDMRNSRPTLPLLIGKVALNNNKLIFDDNAIALNLDEYSSPEAQTGLELEAGKVYDQKSFKDLPNAVNLNPKASSLKKLTQLSHGHYDLNNGDQAFNNLRDVLGDDGGKHIQAAIQEPKITKVVHENKKELEL